MLLTTMMVLKCFCICFFVYLVTGLNNNIRSYELCLDCLENVVTTRCNLPFCPSNSSCLNKIDLNKFGYKMSAPILVCRDDNSLTLSWNHMDEMYYFIEYSVKESKQSRFTELTRCNFITLNGLTKNENYSLYLFGFSLAEKKVYKSRELIRQTSKNIVKRTSVKMLNYTLGLTENSYVATVEWTPGSDFSCLYEIVWYGKHEPGEYMNRKINLKKQPYTKFNLTNLEFGKKYYFSITSINLKGDSESPKKYLKVIVPNCLETFNNLSICPPNRPKNVKAITENSAHQNISIASYTNQTNLKLSWNIPELLPDYYKIYFASFGQSSNDSFTFSTNVSGDQNLARLINLEFGNYYIIKLVAYSKGGASAPAYVREYSQQVELHTTNETTSKNTPQIPYITEIFTQWIWIGIMTTFVLITMFIYRHRFKKFVFSFVFFKEKVDDTIVRYAASETEDSEWELAESKLLIDKVIGFGAFGIVQKGYYYLEPNKKTELAVKTLKAKPTEEEIAQFYDEIEIMKSVPRHAHIVYLIGVVSKHRPNNPLMLVEYCAHGDLQSFLRKVAFILGDSKTNAIDVDPPDYSNDGTKFFNKSYDLDTSILIMNNRSILDSKDLLFFARQIAVGMEFLSNLKVIHRDLAARNVLISENNTLKISDFGLSRDIYTDNIYKKVTGGKLPFRWMALESLTHQVYTTESDVWSFGIVLWEIVTLGGNPYPTVNTEDLVILLKSGYRMEKPITCSKELYEIMLDCWQTSPNLRASFKELREVFDKLLESEMQYISLEDAKKIDLKHYENLESEPEESVAERYIVQSSNIM